MDEQLKIQILNILNESKNPLGVVSIAKNIGIKVDELKEYLIELESDLRVRSTRKGKYTISEYIFGELDISKNGSGFVKRLNEKDIFIPKNNLKNALSGDVVAVLLTDKNNGEVIIIKILSKERSNEVGTVIEKDNNLYIKIDDIKKKNLLITFENDSNLLPGYKVMVKITDFIYKDLYKGEVVKVIGHVNDPGIDIIGKAATFDIDNEFSPEALLEAENIPTYVRKEDLEGRKDLRDEITVAIDGKNAKDKDDAITIRMLEYGNILLMGHISHVSYYIKEDSHLNKEALRKGMSFYYANKVFPMFPYNISSGICSLNEGVDRLTRTFMIEYNPRGSVVSYNIGPSVINSNKTMTYEKVNECFEKRSDDSYLPYIEMLNNGLELSQILRKKRYEKGSIDFKLREMEIITDDYSRVTDIRKRKDGLAENMIEEFMLAIDTVSALDMLYLNNPFLFRIHEEPYKDKIYEVVRCLKILSGRTIHLPKIINSKTIQQILDLFRDDPNYEIYSYLLLRCMQQARYSIDNIGHFALASNAHDHITAPIRRVTDLENHRIYDRRDKGIIYNEEKLIDESNRLKELAIYVSKKERIGNECELAINKMKSAEYMENYINESFMGKITSVTDFGFYVDIYNGVEGLVKISSLDKAKYNSDKYAIIDVDNSYQIGDSVEVIVTNTNKMLGQIDLRLERKLEKCDYINKKTLRRGIYG